MALRIGTRSNERTNESRRIINIIMPCETQRAELRHLINNITNRRMVSGSGGEGGWDGRLGGRTGGQRRGDIKRNNGVFFLAIGEPGMIEGVETGVRLYNRRVGGG